MPDTTSVFGVVDVCLQSCKREEQVSLEISECNLTLASHMQAADCKGKRVRSVVRRARVCFQLCLSHQELMSSSSDIRHVEY